ncbi:MAG: hypothetical protein E7812_15995 [Phenylobacterium sp.]|nr:MAG: hypothetical protein E7812_15995 [Phenylobacterium sp.]
MRRLIIAAAAFAALATPALAGTLQEVTTHGMIVTIQDMNIDVEFTPDGKFTALDGQVTGAWRIDGDKLCTTSNAAPAEACVAYPKDKKSGDTFDVTGDQGSATIHIK